MLITPLSLWGRRSVSINLVRQTVLVAALLSSSAANAHQVTRNLSYTSPGCWPADVTKLDIYTANGGITPGAPTILNIHGGGYTSGDKRDDGPVCGLLADRGFNVVSINYTLATPGVPSFPQPVRDAKAAIRWIRTEGVALGLSPTIVVIGTSAGSTIGVAAAFSEGHADFELLAPPLGGYRVDAVVGVSGRYDLVWDAMTNGTPQPLAAYLGGPITNETYSARFSNAAAISYVSPCTPPTKLIHGDLDPVVPFQHSLRLSGAMSGAGNFNILQILPGAGHGSGSLASSGFVADAIANAIPQLLANPVVGCNTSNPITSPANDRCTDASLLVPGSMVMGTTLGAIGTIVTPCGNGTDTRDVWYRFTPPLTRRYTFDSIRANPSFDTTIGVYSTCSPGAGLVACDQGSGGAWCAQVSAVMSAGQHYYIRVSGVNGAAGPFTLNAGAGVVPGGDVPANDMCDSAQQVSVGSTLSTTVNATGNGTSQCGINDYDDVWFQFVSPNAAVFRINTSGSPLLPDTTLVAFDACSSEPLACNDNAAFDQPYAQIDLPLQYGQSVLVRIAGEGGVQGRFSLNIEQLPRPDQGACCRQSMCDIRSADDCGTGVWYQLLACSLTPCVPPPPPGACCNGTTCTMADDAVSCVGAFLGAGMLCASPQNPIACCPANFNRSGGVTVQDIFDFLSAYFSSANAGDFNGTGACTVQDVFDFLSAYFTGCGA